MVTTWTNVLNGAATTVGATPGDAVPATLLADVLQISNSGTGLDATLRDVGDGDGTTVPLKVSTSAVMLPNAAIWPYGDSTFFSSGRTGILIPYYIYPNNPYSDTTCARLLGLIRQYRGRVPVIVIVNPSSGPGSVMDGNWAAFIKLCQAAGARVAGYVATGYAVTAEAGVKASVDTWLTLYADTPVDTIFFDEQTYDLGTNNANVALYKRYTDYCHARNLAPVICNPGVNQREEYFAERTGDIIVTAETGTWPTESDMLGAYVGGHIDYKTSLRAALVYGQSSLGPGRLRQLARYVQWVYVTDDALSPNPWDSLSGHLESVFGTLAGRDVVSVLDFGAVGDGATDDRAAIQLALSSGARVVRFPALSYKVVPNTLHATGWTSCLIVPTGVSVIFEPGALVTCDVAFAAKAVIFMVRGSNILLERVAVTNTLASGNPYAIGVGGGNEYDDNAINMSHITVRGGVFTNNWLSVTFQCDGGVTTIGDITIEQCWSYAKSTATSSGNFNCRSDLATRRITDVKMIGNRAYYGTTASAYNLVGIENFTVENNYAFQNSYAGCETENGCRYGLVTGNKFHDCSIGVWCDDSTFITISNNSVYYNGLASAIVGVETGILLTRQGWAEDADPQISGVRILNNTILGEAITIGTYGGAPAGDFLDYEISGNYIHMNGRTVATGILLPTCALRRITGNTVIGASTTSLSLSGATTDKIMLNGNITAKQAAEASAGLNNVSSITTIQMVGNNFDNGITSINGTSGTHHANMVSGAVHEMVDDGFKIFHGGTAPEGVTTAGPGSLYRNSANGQLYIKESGSGNTGWIALLSRSKSILTVGGALTIAAGVVTITNSIHAIDTEAAAATDDLDTISGGTTGQLLVLSADNSARDVVLKDGTGNLRLSADFTMTHIQDRIVLVYDGIASAWHELCRSDNAA